MSFIETINGPLGAPNIERNNMRNLIAKTLGIFAAVMITFASMSAMAGGANPHGTFTGASDHITTGGVKIIKTANGGAVVILDSDFSLDGAPDPRVGFCLLYTSDAADE